MRRYPVIAGLDPAIPRTRGSSPRVTMSEYVAIAYAFFTGKEPGLANGVLDRLARTLRGPDL